MGSGKEPPATPADDDPDARQARYWNSPATAPWVTLQDRLDTLLAPLLAAIMARAEVRAGEHVLDVGCGCGATVLDLAHRVGPSGQVHGVDISAPMLARAEARIAEAGLSQVMLTLADAGRHDLPRGAYDLVLSRLGVMFFGAPVEAFRNLHRALKPSGRLVFVCFRTPAENPYITTALAAAKPLLPEGAVPVPGPEEPGMFSLADPARIRRILQEAGFRTIEVAPHDERMRLGGPGGVADAAEFSIRFGPLTRAMDPQDAALRSAVLGAVTAAYAGLEGPEGIVLDGAFWIVAARP
ncbi:class I SAM-dependent methyltransferase [Neoroseomonas soli]|uniref:Class I SAM-dependent methyltransferase n=1 Tax=Neoroseomonas soli TaxID=1081025 RepID=A0A9X9WYB4_9PROT|nr:class I SAM-dependent methyltransferase [Neoroseomonas soli]MBR0672143.1 class I SAM-dependent methyltransferase [Neoroseomonas soli]